ncbi:hypothetical protein [uncultured Corynebacterium sp.]|mgnify:CR=1 FL=1|uniref:hypothetical protein n=1 Tax=uncultured Corynebacterium sp. TaxID=159447 RepID=UPI0025FA36D2|nr:hypothetical protein [uncultured Corynebacterium sp.]
MRTTTTTPAHRRTLTVATAITFSALATLTACSSTDTSDSAGSTKQPASSVAADATSAASSPTATTSAAPSTAADATSSPAGTDTHRESDAPAASAAPATDSAGDAPDPVGSSPSKAELDALAQTPLNPGDAITLGGQAATACIYGDGWGLNLLIAGANTSCDFATAVFKAQSEGLNATEDNIRDHLAPSINVVSPVTNQAYDMSCSTNADKLITCTGGNGASV